jgi:hypothetical protein
MATAPPVCRPPPPRFARDQGDIGLDGQRFDAQAVLFYRRRSLDMMTEQSTHDCYEVQWVEIRVGTRRAALRVVAGGMVGGVVASLLGVAETRAFLQGTFHACSRCKILVERNISPGNGGCAAGGDHQLIRKRTYGVYFGQAAGPNEETGWRMCAKCAALYWSAGATTAGRCPLNGSEGFLHRENPGYSGVLEYNVAPEPSEQGGWRWCNKCSSLFRPNRKRRGACPAGDKHAVNPNYAYNLDVMP